MGEKWVRSVCDRLRIHDPSFIEIESKRRVLPEEIKDVRKFLVGRKGVHHQKATVFFDQFLDTPKMEIFRRGASLRLRYKKSGSRVYLQYKGPGFLQSGVLYRSEFSTGKLQGVLMEESHHDIVHFNETSIQDILTKYTPFPMAMAMQEHLGAAVIRRISSGPIISIYQKDKFIVEMGKAFLEPSLDQVFAFHLSKKGVHPLSSFCEYENEIKAEENSLERKAEHIEDLLDFNRKLIDRFDMPPEPLDKYHRCASSFLPFRKTR